MKYTLAAVAILLLAPGLADSKQPSPIVAERTIKDAIGNVILEREAFFPSENGGQTLLKIHFMRGRNGELIYKFDEQSPTTKRFHEEQCKTRSPGAAPFKGDTVVAGENALGAFFCAGPFTTSPQHGVEVDGVFTPTPTKGSESEDSKRAPDARAIDIVRVWAPGGTVSYGRNFCADGYITYQTSKAGQISLQLNVDGNRCSPRRMG